MSSTPISWPSDADLVAALVTQWSIREPHVQAHDGGMNSRTWLVRDGSTRWIAKVVPMSQAAFPAGLAVTRLVEAAGVPAGAPRRTIDGRDVVRVGDHFLCLLRFVDGTPLLGATAADRQLIGNTLARVHEALADVRVADETGLDWIDVTAPHLDVGDWIRPSVSEAVRAIERLPGPLLTLGLLHSDPAPEAFRVDEQGICGLIDWDRALRGPLLYDLASAVMYVGGPSRGGDLVDAYLGAGRMQRVEVDRGLLPMLRFRWAVQADYFARRIAEVDLTGISGHEENWKGLEDARRGLTGA